ncbi:MAG: hypothetical protein U5R14_10635 [Gemmatimonadota bacterium]|nr:hypothetical protein [Gemmatimonadota bacterium]
MEAIQTRERASELGSAYEVVASRSDASTRSRTTSKRLERWLEGGVDTIVVRGQMPPDDFRTPDRLRISPTAAGCSARPAARGYWAVVATQPGADGGPADARA